MWDWLKAAQTIHTVAAVLAAIGFFHFWVRSRFWFPRYVHYLGGFALALGVACLVWMPPEAPINQAEWAGLKKGLLVLVFPGLVYFFFVFYGGQRVAYERTHLPHTEPCPYCQCADAVRGFPCPNSGQTVAQ
jgi:hypothetical protein